MTTLDTVTPDSYANEPVKYPPLKVVNLADEAAAVSEPYRNLVINRVNGSCLRLAVYSTTYSGGTTIRHPTNSSSLSTVCSPSISRTVLSFGWVRGRRSPFRRARFTGRARWAGPLTYVSKKPRHRPCSWSLQGRVPVAER